MEIFYDIIFIGLISNRTDARN